MTANTLPLDADGKGRTDQKRPHASDLIRKRQTAAASNGRGERLASLTLSLTTLHALLRRYARRVGAIQW